MFKKGNLILLVALLLLVGAYFFITNQDRKKGERTFKSELVEIDEAEATKLVINSAKNEQPLELNKVGDDWQVSLKDGSKVKAMPEVVSNTFKELQGIKTSQIVARTTAKWADYKVDDQGTKVQVFEGSNKALDIVLGKFDIDPASLQQQGQGGQFGGQSNPKFTSYVRLQGEDEIYSVSGFFEGLASQTADNYRDKQLFKSSSEDINQINFNYPDSAFQVILRDTVWMFANSTRNADSMKVAQYISNLATTNGSKFVEKPAGEPVVNVEVKAKDGSTTIFNAYALPKDESDEKATQNYAVSSNGLSNSYFDANASGLFTKLFVGKDNFKK